MFVAVKQAARETASASNVRGLLQKSYSYTLVPTSRYDTCALDQITEVQRRSKGSNQAPGTIQRQYLVPAGTLYKTAVRVQGAKK